MSQSSGARCPQPRPLALDAYHPPDFRPRPIAGPSVRTCMAYNKSLFGLRFSQLITCAFDASVRKLLCIETPRLGDFDFQHLTVSPCPAACEA
jgi:hypothetical protein